MHRSRSDRVLLAAVATGALVVIVIGTIGLYGGRSDDAQTTVPGPSPSHEVPASSNNAAAAMVLFPELPLLAATSQGDLQRYENGSWRREVRVCETAIARSSFSVDGTYAWLQCDGPGSPSTVRRAFVYELRQRKITEVEGTTELGIGPISPDGRYVVAVLPGDCTGSAPVCQSRWIMVDLQTNQRSELLPSGHWLALEMSWTRLGLAYFRAECSEAGCIGPDQAGTYLWDGRSWKKVSQHRLVTLDTDAHWALERRRSLTDRSANVSVVERVGGSERVVTPAGVSRELALAVNNDALLAFRPADSSETSGRMVLYLSGTEVRSSLGLFSTLHVVRANDWVVSVDVRPGATQLRAYSLSLDAFASKPAEISISGLTLVRASP